MQPTAPAALGIAKTRYSIGGMDAEAKTLTDIQL